MIDLNEEFNFCIFYNQSSEKIKYFKPLPHPFFPLYVTTVPPHKIGVNRGYAGCISAKLFHGVHLYDTRTPTLAYSSPSHALP